MMQEWAPVCPTTFKIAPLYTVFYLRAITSVSDNNKCLFTKKKYLIYHQLKEFALLKTSSSTYLLDLNMSLYG
jgi:hypothetical protein